MLSIPPSARTLQPLVNTKETRDGPKPQGDLGAHQRARLARSITAPAPASLSAALDGGLDHQLIASDRERDGAPIDAVVEHPRGTELDAVPFREPRRDGSLELCAQLRQR